MRRGYDRGGRQNMMTVDESREKLKQRLLKIIESGAANDLAGAGDASRIMRLALIATDREPRLLDCTPTSMIAAVLEAIAMGLDVNTPLEHASINAEMNASTNQYEAGYQVHYKGLIVLAKRSGVVKSVHSRLVYAQEEFQVVEGTEHKITHIPIIGNGTDTERGAIIAAYAVARIPDGSHAFEVMGIDDLETHRRKYAIDPDSGAWERETGLMYRKTVLKRLLYSLPVESEDFASRIQRLDDKGRVAAIAPVVDAAPPVALQSTGTATSTS
jgi:phage RecT family recombinase